MQKVCKNGKINQNVLLQISSVPSISCKNYTKTKWGHHDVEGGLLQ